MGKERTPSDLDFGIRVGAVVERDGRILLVRHEKPGRKPYLVLPGGRLEPRETIPECAARELAEETGLRGRFGRILYVSEFFDGGRHTVDITVLMEEVHGEATLGHDPEVEPGATPTLRGLVWVELGRLGEANMLPHSIRDRLARGLLREEPEIYLGSSRDN
ncbi:NUDIX domain-containing protein [Rubrobacter calidifluminis]|uniref:NUDIX domain-containing protein n=1 Tax=Rubrobacter calidifluminis TaxID=1392640 RepID=UPI002361C755|nr:NUDIX domain-containing protein [Rubrobacter calidifluminis]